jgi:hypothetical protein
MDYYSLSTQELLKLLEVKETQFESAYITNKQANQILFEIEEIEQILEDRNEN